jgi:hypothetical protein
LRAGERRLLLQRCHHCLDGSKLLPGLLQQRRDALACRVLGLAVPRRGNAAGCETTVVGGLLVPLSGTPTHEPLGELLCSMTMAEVAREDRKQE